jgi:xanthine dehydrogenase iron-sulfur cluster and FAD-binding subunit A
VWHSYYTPTHLDDALALLAQHQAEARVVAGGTDLLLEIERKLRSPRVLIDITRLAGLDQIRLDGEMFHLGPLATHNQVASSPLVVERAFPLARACAAVGAPQIRNRATVAGNLITASPANDTITALRVLEASVTLKSVRGERTLPLAEFYKGVRKTALAPDEMLVDISWPALRPAERGTFVKLGLRQTQAISVVNAAVVLSFEAGRVQTARLTFGSVAPTIVRAPEAERALTGQALTDAVILEAGRLARAAAKPISDVRSPANYRAEMIEVLTVRALRSLQAGAERADWPAEPARLWGKTEGRYPPATGAGVTHSVEGDEPIQTTVNGQPYTVRGANDDTLLHMLREDIGLTGSKEGCGEGECGACTVYLDGIAVMACLVPAPRAHGAEIVTVEGLQAGEALHPVQQSFIDADAIQCGYCTPGFVMAAAKLLEELPHPTPDQIKQGISGNLCRCTGYVNIVRAIERAAAQAA